MLPELRAAALDIFGYTLAAMDARAAVLNSTAREGDTLRVRNAEYDLRSLREVYAVAVGKAAAGMARALDEVLAGRITAGVISAPRETLPAGALSPMWQVFAGGHPVPDAESLHAGSAALAMLDRANHEGALVVFLISGGGSAMCEAPLDPRITLDELRAANELFVTCGATIDEINFLRQRLSAVKGGRLAARAERARQITLIISDTNVDAGHTVASGPSIAPPTEAYDVQSLLREYDLEHRLPPSVVHLLAVPVGKLDSNSSMEPHSSKEEELRAELRFAPRELNPRRYCFQLLDQNALVASAAHRARNLGFDVTHADDLVEQPIEQGAAELVRRFIASREAADAGRRVCLISAGEFRCPVRGRGVGGRNSETVLRALLALDELKPDAKFVNDFHATILSAGTDGIDGNSPAAGALGDSETLARARTRKLDATSFLLHSDSYTFFHHLGDDLITGATGTNVRDLRLFIA